MDTKNMALMCMINRQRKCTAHQAWLPRAQSKRVIPPIFRIRQFLPLPAPITSQWHPETPLRTGVRAITQLIFQPLEANRVACPSGKKRGTKKQDRPPAVCAAPDAHRFAAPRKTIYAPPAIRAIFQTLCAGGVAHDIGTTCFSVIPMPINKPRFCPPGNSENRSDRSTAAWSSPETARVHL